MPTETAPAKNMINQYVTLIRHQQIKVGTRNAI